MSEEKRALTLEDFWRLKTVADPQPSPDGTAGCLRGGQL